MTGSSIFGRIRPGPSGVAALCALALTACGGAEEDGAHGTQAPDRGQTTAENTEITDAWVPEPADPDTGVLYLRAHNTSEQDEAIVGAATDVSADAELYTNETAEADAGQMRVVDEIPVPAGGSTELVSGGFHIMMNGLEAPLELGDTVDVTLTLDSGEEVELEAPVEARSTDSDDDHIDHGDHGHH